MSHEIDLSKYNLRTDLALEAIKNIDSVKSKNYQIKDIKVTDIYVDQKLSKKINKKIGNYTTIEFKDVTDYINQKQLTKVFIKELKKKINHIKLAPNDLILIIGLGNEKAIADSLGPLVINNIIVTNHLFEIGSLDNKFKRVSALAPGVMGQTGIETSEIILSVVKTTNPALVIVIDALASCSIEKLNKTIQMTDTGINPGSGIGNHRKEISSETLNVPVIALGIPTVVDAVTIVSDTFSYIHQKYSYFKNNNINKLIPTNKINYLKKDNQLDLSDKQNLLGMIGTLNEAEIKQLIFEVLTPIGYNLMVTTKEIDFIISKLSSVISQGINQVLHNQLNNM